MPNDYPTPSELVQFLNGAGFQVPDQGAADFQEQIDRSFACWFAWRIAIDSCKAKVEGRDLQSILQTTKISKREVCHDLGVSTDRTLLSYWVGAKLGSAEQFRSQVATGEFDFIQFRAMERVAEARRAAGGKAKAARTVSNRAQKK